MKLATFSVNNGADELGVVQGERVISLSRAAPMFPSTMMGLIARWAELERDARSIVKEQEFAHDLRAVHLKAPIPRPGKIMAIGLNYADHVKETGAETPKDQVWFCKQPTAVNGPFDPIQIPKASPMVDWEAKGFDTHAPFGPWITTADEVGDPHTLGIKCVVNGETRQSSNTSNLVFRVEDQLALLSQAMTLEPGDLIYTGTPGGVGMAMNPQLWLKPGDTVRVEIEKLGAIEAVCVAEK